MTTTIRPPTPEDHSAWLRLWRGYQTFYKADLTADEPRLWQALLSPRPEGPFCLLAFDDSGEAIGLAQFLYHVTTWSPAPRCYLNDLFTDEAARGKGIGEALIEAVTRRAVDDGCGQVWWLTAHDNHRARMLYDRVATLTPFIKYAR